MLTSWPPFHYSPTVPNMNQIVKASMKGTGDERGGILLVHTLEGGLSFRVGARGGGRECGTETLRHGEGRQGSMSVLTRWSFQAAKFKIEP
jgi:hypothetical protein